MQVIVESTNLHVLHDNARGSRGIPPQESVEKQIL